MQKYVHLVDLVESFPTSIWSQNSASIQPRTSLSKFGENELIIQSTPYEHLVDPDDVAVGGLAHPVRAERAALRFRDVPIHVPLDVLDGGAAEELRQRVEDVAADLQS